MKKILFVLLLCIVATDLYAETAPIQLSLVPDFALHSRETRITGFALNLWGENPQSGFALGILNGSTGDSVGFSLGLVNYAENYTGLEMGTLNLAEGTFTGVQYGVFNYASNLSGLQIGVANVADTTTAGVQIGFLNIIMENGWFNEFPNALAPGMIFINWRF